MGDNKGQISFEYLMIFAISLIMIIIFTLPLTHLAVEDTLDVSDALNVKSDLSQLSHAIKEVYGQGQGSKQMISLNEKNKIKLTFTKGYVSCDLKLKDNSIKTLRQNYNSNLEKTSLTLDKGVNNILVQWPEGSENMKIVKV